VGLCEMVALFGSMCFVSFEFQEDLGMSLINVTTRILTHTRVYPEVSGMSQ